MRPPPLILASSSPRRVGYLKQLGLHFKVARPRVDERPRRGENPRGYVGRLAREKARQVAETSPRGWVVAADTAVVVDGSILGKPKDEREAKRMLRRLSGRWHQVVSGLALVSKEKGWESAGVSLTRVRFRKMSEVEIAWYVATGEPFGKAGAYAIQGKGGLFVDRIVGSPSNVVGFPVEIFYALWRQAQLPFP